MKDISNKPAVLWFLNTDLREEEIRSQLRAMNDGGIGGTFMHWIINGPGYMSETWMKALDVVVEESAKLGMDAWLYDEAWCPSCYAGGIILAERPDLQAKTLWSESIDVRADGKAKLNFDLMKILSAVALPIEEGIPQISRAVDISKYLGPRAEAIDTPYRHDWGYYPISKPKLHWRAAKKGEMRWELEWAAPSGSDWRVYVFCQREALQWDGFNRLDVLNSESIKYFLKETHEKYAERFSKYFGNVIPGIMTDEYKFLSGAWTEKLTKLYMDRHKNDLIELLPALVDDSIPESKVVRNNYHRLVNDLFLENYTVPMKKWCSDNNLILTGHISPEEHATVEVKCAGNIAAHIAHFDMPGCDIIIQAVGDREHPDLNLSPRLAASVARQQGISKVFVEAGACSEENLSIESLKHLIDWLMVHGINFINIHGFSYSLSGYHKFLAGQTLDPYGNLLTHFKNLSEYVEERCETLTEFRPVAKIAVLKPLTALRTLIKICDSEEPQSAFIDKALTEISMELIENHLEFDLLDEDGAENWRIETNSLQVGKCAYEVVIIPECGHLSESAHTQLASFAKNGGTVIAHASVPDFISTSAITTVADNTIFRIATTAEESAKLAAENCKSGITVSGPDARSVHMFKGENASGEKLCFMVNISSDSPASITIEADGETLNLKLAPRESRMIPLPFANISKKANREIRETLTPLGDWKISTKNVNHFPLESGMTIEIESGAVVESLVCDKANIAELRDTLKINGKTLDWESAESAKFYTVDNALLPVGEHFNIGRNNVQFDAEAMPTLLIAGDFSVSEKEDNRMVLKKKIESAANVSRIDSGFAFLRGELVFETRFTIPESIEGAQLRFVDRTGSIKVELDGEEKGIVAWSPDILDIGDLAAGEHSVRLKVVGAGIGLFHSGFFEAGCSGIEIWY